MFGIRKKKACPIEGISEKLKEHIDTVEYCMELSFKSLESYLDGDIDNAKEYAKSVDKAESEADCVRRRISICLFEGSLMPFLRKDFLQLINAIDEIANGSEAISDFCLGQRPEIPDFLIQDILSILDLTKEIFNLLKASLYLLSEGKFSYDIKDIESLHALTQTVVKKESKIDDIQWKITRAIFNSTISLSHKIHIENFLSRICDLSDFIEDVVERIEIIAAKEAI